MKRRLIGAAAALASMAILTSAMIPLRHSLSIATSALILVVPVVIPSYRIRRKLHDENGQLPQSDPSVGYRFAVPGP